MASHRFSIPDYIVFSLTMVISLGIGVYSALSGGRQRSTQEFLVGNRQLKVIPVTLSLIVSFESSIMMLGFPAEAYTYGITLWWSSVSNLASLAILAFLMVPTFFDLKIISAYEYLRARFDSRVVQLMGSCLGAMYNLWYMGIVLFGPATAIHAVTGFTTWYSVFIIAIVAMIYTTIVSIDYQGGIKAVVLADAFQAFIMIGGMLAVLIKGTLAVGGVSRVMEIADKGGRLNFFVFDVDPTVRMTFWGVTIGSILRTMSIGTQQTTIQRIATMPTKGKAKLITVLTGPGFFLFGTLAFAEGIVAYAYFTSINCDPLEAGLIKNPNQIMPFFVMELFSRFPGLPGLFLAALFSASLSTLSSGYASVSAIVWSDLIKPHFPNVSEFQAAVTAKVLVVISGFLSIGVAILVMQVGGPMNQISGTLLSAFAGPLAGVFLLGGIVPRSNAKGAIAGLIASSAFALWKGMGSSFSPDGVKTPYLPSSSISHCNQTNVTTYSKYTLSDVVLTPLHTTPIPDRHASALTTFYSISYLWISPMAIVITIIVGTVVSYATGSRQKDDIDPRYLMPICDRLFCCLPEKIRSVFRYKEDWKRESKEMSLFPDSNVTTVDVGNNESKEMSLFPDSNVTTVDVRKNE